MLPRDREREPEPADLEDFEDFDERDVLIAAAMIVSVYAAVGRCCKLVE